MVFVVYKRRINPLKMNTNWNDLELEALRVLFERETARLQNSLLSGCSWEEVKDQRQKVTELSIILHKKLSSSTNPAESTDRSEKRIQR